MRGNVSVRIADGTLDRNVTLRSRGLTFSRSVPGGYEAASMSLRTPYHEFRDLGQNDRLFIYDGSNGEPLWDGYTEQPNPTRGPRGEQFELSAYGGRSLLLDRDYKLMYVDKTLDFWATEDQLTQVAGAQVGGNPYPDGTRKGIAALLAQFPSSTPVATDSEAGMRYYGFTDAAMKPGAVIFTTVAGSASGATKLYGDVDAFTHLPFEVFSVANSTTSSDHVYYARSVPTGSPSSSEFPYDTASLAFALVWTAGASTIATDTVWSGIDPPVVLAQLLDKAGARIDMAGFGGYGAHPDAWVLASDVAADLVGRVLGFVDPDRTSIEATTYEINQLTYPDGVTPGKVFEDLTTFEPDYFHEVLESNEAGLHRFVFRSWDDDNPRYEISTRDGFEAPGGETTLCNRMAVRWTDEKGKRRETVVTAAVPALDSPALGPARERFADPITLPDGLGSEENATQIGTQRLAQANRGARAGSALVRRPVHDLFTGNKVMPWQIEPGYPVLVRETEEIHRLTRMEYADDSCSTALTLGDPLRSDDQLLADAVGKRGHTVAKASR